MRNLTGVVALGALALASFSTVTALGLARDLRARDAAPPASADALAALEARLGALELAVMLSTTGIGGKPPALPDDARPPAPPTSAASPGATGLASAPRPAPSLPDVERRLAELERQLADAERRSGVPTAQSLGGAIELPTSLDGGMRYVSSVEDAERHFELTPAQKSDLERVIADSAREREALHRLPGEDGKTWEETAKEAVRILGDGMVQFDGDRLSAFRERLIPGRAESFGAADRRITETARRRIEEGLSPDQRKRFEKTNVDGLVGGGSPSSGVSFSLFAATEIQLPAPAPQPAGGK